MARSPHGRSPRGALTSWALASWRAHLYTLVWGAGRRSRRRLRSRLRSRRSSARRGRGRPCALHRGVAGERAGPLGILFVFIRRRECARYFYILWLSLFENCTRGYISLAVVCPQPSSLYMCRNAHVYNYKYMSRSVSSLNIYVSRNAHMCACTCQHDTCTCVMYACVCTCTCVMCMCTVHAHAHTRE